MKAIRHVAPSTRMKTMSNNFASRFADRPVMIEPTHESWLEQCLSGVNENYALLRQQMAANETVFMADDDFWPEDNDSWLAWFRPYNVKDGTLTIPVKGVLLHDFPYSLGTWATGYIYIRKAMERGLNDPQVQRIVFDINSGGGEVAGNFDLVDWMYRQRGIKPSLALIDEHAYSAAFSIATAADRRVLPRTGGVGSVGVVTSHMDVSKMLDNYGVKITFIHAGKHKVDGNPYEPLPKDVKDRIQVRIDGLYGIFTSTVARNLGLDEEIVRNTEALTFSADEAIEIGFADEILATDEALAGFSGLSATPGEIVMSENSEVQQESAKADQAALDSARAEGRNEGATAERERIQAILGCDEAKPRSALAFHLAMNTDQSVESAKGILAASPEEKPDEQANPKSAFEQAMEHNNPDIEAEGGDDTQEVDASQQLINDYHAATGYGNKAK